MPARVVEGRRLRVLAFASYVVLAIFVVGPSALATPDTVAGKGIDLPGTIWIHWWFRTCLERFQLPVATDLLFYPDGKNFFNDTGANYLDALVGVPLQWIFGVPDFLDVLQVVVLTGNALAMYALVSEVTERRAPAAAWAAALAFEVNPFVVQQVNEGRPTQAMVWFGVLAARALWRVPTGSWRDAAMFGTFTALQGLTYWFSVYFLALGLLPLASFQVARNPRVVAPRLALAVAVAVAVVSPFLLGIAHAIDAGEVRRLGFGTWEDSPVAAPARWRLVVDQLATAASLVTVLVGLVAWRRTWPLLLGAALTIVFSFGGRLDVVQPPVTNGLFVALWDTLPLLPRLGFPDRAAMGTFLLLPLAAGIGLARLDAVYAALFAAVVVGEGFYRGALPVTSTKVAVPLAASVVKEGGGGVIFVPFGASDDAMVHQTFHGQPLFGGMGEREPDMRPAGYSERLRNGFVVMLGGTLNDTDAPIAYTREERAEVSRLFRWVWFDRRYGPPAWKSVGYDASGKFRRLVKELGKPVFEDKGVAIWDLHQPVRDTAPGLGADAVRTGGELERLPTGNLGPEKKPGKGPGTHPGGPASPGGGERGRFTTGAPPERK